MLGLNPSSGGAGGEEGGDRVEWESLVDHLPTLYSWAKTAVQRLSNYARNHPTAAPAAALCRAAFEGMHADDTGGGTHFSPAAVSMLKDAAEQANALSMPLERLYALELLAIYSPYPNERVNALRKAHAEMRTLGVTYHADVCERLKREQSAQRDKSISRFKSKHIASDVSSATASKPPGRRFSLRRRISVLPQTRSHFLRKFSLSAGGIRPALLDLCAVELARPADHPAAASNAVKVDNSTLLAAVAVSSTSAADAGSAAQTPDEPVNVAEVELTGLSEQI